MQLVQSDVDINPCAQVYTLAKQVYRSEEVIPVEILERWWIAHPQLFYLAYNDETLCGYTSALPLTEKAFAKTLRQDFDEKAIQAKDIITFDKTGDFYLYFSSIVVHPEWRTKGVSSLLRQGFLQGLLNLYAEDKHTRALSSWVVSEKGGKMMQSLGMQFYAQAVGGTIYYCEQTKESLEKSLDELKS